MIPLDELLKRFVQQSSAILEGQLTGVYLHGSAAMGCFRTDRSDVDLIVVVRGAVPREKRRAFLDMVVTLNRLAPAKGIEMSIVQESFCRPFVYPTPYELHFSNAHLGWYESDPEGYVDGMQGTDKDLAAHFTILYHRGKALYGPPIREVFAPVPAADYWDSIRFDVENAEEEIAANPTYMILNLCRVLAYQKEGLILSKHEGGQWGAANEPDYAVLISSALAHYNGHPVPEWNENQNRQFAIHMLQQINNRRP